MKIIALLSYIKTALYLEIPFILTIIIIIPTHTHKMGVRCLCVLIARVVDHVAIVTIVHGSLAHGNRLHSTHCREFHFLKLCRAAYFVR